MNIIHHELKKVFTAPIIWSLILIFLLFNSFVIFSNAPIRNDLGILTEMVERYGHEINEETLANWQARQQEVLAQLNEATTLRVGQTFSSVDEFFADSARWEFEQSEIDPFIEGLILEMYLARIANVDEVYAQIDLSEKAEILIHLLQATGNLADTVRERYAATQPRIEQLIENEEHLHFFFDGLNYEMHTFLFQTILRTTAFEIAILTILLTAYLLSFEFDQKTSLVTYATKCGRRLQKEKLKAALIATTLVTIGMIFGTLFIYFIVFNHSGLWQVPMSSMFMTEKNLFVATFWNLTFFQYLLGVIGLIFGIQLLFSVLIFCLHQFIKNGYLTIIVFGIIFGLALLTPSLFPRHSNGMIYASFTPFMMIMDLHLSFLIGGLATIFKYSEFITLSIWGLILGIGGIFSYQQFKIADL